MILEEFSKATELVQSAQLGWKISFSNEIHVIVIPITWFLHMTLFIYNETNVLCSQCPSLFYVLS